MENMNTDQATQSENMGNETEVQGASQEAGKEQKLFTQEEVNNFVQSRINRIKGQAAKEAKAEYDQKLADLQAREMKIMVKEKLSDRGMPKELADIITCTDEDDLNSKLDALNRIYGNKEKGEPQETATNTPPKGFKFGAYSQDTGHLYSPADNPVRRAMGLERKE